MVCAYNLGADHFLTKKKRHSRRNNSESAALVGLFDCFAVLAGNPADLRINHDSMPAVSGGGDPFESRAVLHRGDAAILRVVAHTNVDRAAAAHDAHLLADGHRLFGRVGVRRGITFAFVIIRHSVHQSLMGFTAIEAVLFDADLPLERLEGLFSFRPELTVSTILWQTVFQLQEEFLHCLYVRTLAAILQSAGAQSGLMRGDYKSRMEGYAIARQNGWMSANDIRELENMNAMSDEEGGNAYLVNGNMIPVNLAGITAFLAAAASAAQAENSDQETDADTPEQEETPPAEDNNSRKRRKPKGGSAP